MSLFALRRDHPHIRLIQQMQDQWGCMRVVDVGHMRCLFFDSMIEQGRMNLRDADDLGFEYLKVMLRWSKQVSAPKRIALLGLGAGRLLQGICQAFPQSHISVIDNRPALFDLVKAHFHWPKHDHIQAIVADAQQWAHETDESYHLLLLDLFDAEGSPDFLHQSAFFRALRQRLKPNGWLIGNFWQREFAPQHRFHQVFHDGKMAQHPINRTGNQVIAVQLSSPIPL